MPDVEKIMVKSGSFRGARVAWHRSRTSGAMWTAWRHKYAQGESSIRRARESAQKLVQSLTRCSKYGKWKSNRLVVEGL
jgi:dihydroxyacid dehydratase/phosphogluconate dehydratase